MIYEFCNNLSPNFEGIYATFSQSKRLNCKGKYFDVRKYIYKNQDNWLKSMKEWHEKLCDLGTKKTPYWWIIDGSRFYTWSPPIYSPYIFTLAISKYCKDKNIRHISLLDCPKEVYEYLKEMDSNAKFIIQKNNVLLKLNTSIYWRRILRNFLSLIINFFNSFRFPPFLNSKTNNEGIYIFSQIFDNIEEKNTSDHYFGEIFEKYETENANNILWLYQYNLNFKSKNSYQNKKMLRNKNYRIIQQLNNPVDILKIILIYFKLINSFHQMSQQLPFFTIEDKESKILPREYFTFLVNGILPLHELFVFFAIKKIIKYNQNLHTIIYPYEEKSWERAILLSAKNSQKTIRTIGYSHSVHWNLHYYFHIKPKSMNNPPRPKIHAVTGVLEKWWLNNIARVPEEKIKIFGSNRHTFCKYNPPNCSFDTSSMKVLIVVGQRYDLNILANYLENEPDIFFKCDLIIRKYPFSWNRDQEIGISKIKNFVKTVNVVNDRPLKTQIKWSDITIYNTSSCGIIAMLSGRIAVNVALHDIFYWNPLEKEGSKDAVIHCKSAYELKKTINQLKDINTSKYTEIQEKQHAYAKKIYSPINNDVIEQLLGKNH